MSSSFLQLGNLAAVLVLACSPGFAQSVTPMRGETRSVVSTFAIRILVGNPYANLQVFGVRVYDDKFLPVNAHISLPTVRLAAQASRSVLVIIPFEAAPFRKVRVCAEGLFQEKNSSMLRTQVCGRFLATYVGK